MDLVTRVQQALSPDLLHPRYRDQPKAHCYVASEALAHLFRQEGRTVEVYRQSVDGGTHWYLRVDGVWIDPTADQFDHEIPYEAGVRTGFLTKQPSRRAQIVLSRM